MGVAEVQLDGICPRGFWRQYASQRRPVIIHGVAENWSSFTDDYITNKAGGAVVMVERRSNNSDAYGQGVKSSMLMRDFIRHMQQGDSNLYLSTQEVGTGRDGHPLLYGPPLVGLEGAFPLQQPLLPNLVPQSINMWMGCAPQGASSGLHHDFHDNLYILLRGTKRFRLYPPSTAHDMYLSGRVRHIHPNGRIVYEDQGDILADGSHQHDVKVWQAHLAADKAAAEVTAAATASEKHQAEAQLEHQLESMLEEGAAHNTTSLLDDYIDSDAMDGTTSDPDDDLASDYRYPTKRHRHHKGVPHDKLQQHQLRQQQEQQSNLTAGTSPSHDPPPPSFSQVDLSLGPAEIQQRFPLFPGLEAAQVVVLQAGDMLYLPAGWFHEVTSYGTAGPNEGHLAINYWYHPPDHLTPSKAGFNKPYCSQYYPSLWANRRSWLQADTQAWWQQQQQRQRHLSSTRPHVGPAYAPHKQKQVLAAGTKRRTIKWAPDVVDVGNLYEARNTRPGTATGSYAITPQHSGLRDQEDNASSDDSQLHDPPDDEQQHHQLGADVAEGIKALEAYFSEDPQAMQQLLGQFLAERRARLTAAGKAHSAVTAPLPRLRGRRHHYTVVVQMAPRHPKSKPRPDQS